VNDKNFKYLYLNIAMPMMTNFFAENSHREWACVGGPLTLPATNSTWRTAAILNFVKC